MAMLNSQRVLRVTCFHQTAGELAFALPVFGQDARHGDSLQLQISLGSPRNDHAEPQQQNMGVLFRTLPSKVYINRNFLVFFWSEDL